MVQLVSKQTNHGTSYQVIEEPCEVDYRVISAEDSGRIDGENRYLTIYLPMSEVRDKCFPLNANPRKPNSIGSNESTDIVVKMRKTISRSPEKFVRLNNGFTCVCSKVEIKNGEVTITWGEGEGILNGGHTYLALLTNTEVTDAVVRAEVIEICDRLNLDENHLEKQNFIKETAIARNANRQLKDFTRSEFEGKHQFFQDHLEDLKGVIYWSEGYEELITEPIRFTDRSAMKAAVFVRYLALLDKEWHWHPTIIPDPRDYEIHNNLLVSGNGTYDQWNIVALDGDNEKNLQRVAPLGRMMLKLVDKIRKSMNYEVDSTGRTTNPIGCGNGFTTTEFFRNWAGARQNKDYSYHDKGAEKVPKSSPHFIAYMINFTRPFIWSGDTEHDSEFIGWYSDPIEVYEELHKNIVKQLSPDFTRFKNGRDLASHNSTAHSIWRNCVEPVWNEKCSLDPDNENFWPEKFFDPNSEKWYESNNLGDWMLCYDKTDDEWSLKERSINPNEDATRPFSIMENSPY